MRAISIKDYSDEIHHWRVSLDESLRQENSWLALAGLIWLEPGSTSFGADESLAIVLGNPKLASVAGEFFRDDFGVDLIVHQGSDVRIDDEYRERVRLKPDTSGDAQMVKVGAYSMMLIERGDRLGIRLWDNGRMLRQEFSGRQWFAIDPAYRLSAAFVPYDPAKAIVIPNELGEAEQELSPGFVEFELEGSTHRLDALDGSSGGLFILFHDESAKIDTYGSGRFLVTPAPIGGQVNLDFNRAYNPPCAFTPYATCPLPPEQNFLNVAIRAGEKYTASSSSEEA